MPKVSVIIPAYQSAKFIREAIDSVLNQTYKDYEIIVVDDGSTDNTEEVLASYRDKIRVIRQKNMGVSAARNRGIMSSKGEYVAFLDADDIWLPDKLELQVKLLEEKPEIGLVFSDTMSLTEKDVPFRDIQFAGKRSFQISRPFRGEVFNQLFIRNFIGISTVMLRRRCLKKVGLFDSKYNGCDDYEMWLLLSKCFQVDYIDKPLAIYRIHASSMMHDLEKYLKHLISVRKKVLKESPSLLRALDSEIINSVCYRLYVYLGMLYMWKGDQERARKNYQEYIHLYPYDPRIYFLLLATFLPFRLISGLQHILEILYRSPVSL